MDKQNNLKKEIIFKVKELRKNWIEIEEMFSCIDSELDNEWSLGCPTNYPFEKSFDEYYFKISNWIESMEESIKE